MSQKGPSTKTGGEEGRREGLLLVCVSGTDDGTGHRGRMDGWRRGGMGVAVVGHISKRKNAA